VTVRGIVDIAGFVLKLADSSPQDETPQVTPLRVDELLLATEILNPGLRHIGATTLDIGAIAREGCSRTIDDVGREAAVAAALEHQMPGGPRSIEFVDDENGRRRAFWTGEPEAGRTEPSNHILLGLATAAIDERVVTAERLIVVFYDEGQLEPVEQPIAWLYVTQILPKHVPSSVDHVVVIFSSERLQKHHLRGTPSLRGTLDGNRLIQRQLNSTNQNLTRRLNGDQHSHLVLFLGAGFTASMGMPLGNTIRDVALRQLLPSDVGVGDADLPQRFFELMDDQDTLFEFERGRPLEDLAQELTFERVFREELLAFDPSPTLAELERLESQALGLPPTGAVRHLKSMISGTRKLVLVTVNFDRLIEHNDDRLEVFADEADFEHCASYVDEYLLGGGDAAKTPLLKLHGSLSAQDSLVASIEQTLIGLSEGKAEGLRRACRREGRGRVPFVYVGASMRDLDIGLELSQPSYARDLDEHWVMPILADSVTQFVHARRLVPWQQAEAQDLRGRLITWTADEFFESLAASW
jgi:hypothetical protein